MTLLREKSCQEHISNENDVANSCSGLIENSDDNWRKGVRAELLSSIMSKFQTRFQQRKMMILTKKSSRQLLSP